VAKFKLYVDTGFAGAEHVDEYEIDDDTLKEMTAKEIEDELSEAAEQIMFNYVQYGWKVWRPEDNYHGDTTTEEDAEAVLSVLLEKGIDYA
jgi:hypothetical protein